MDYAVLSQSEVNDLYEMFSHLASVLNKYAFHWSVTDGTLLGCIRNNGLIMYDDDIDLCIDVKDVGLLIHLKSIITKRDKYKLTKQGKYYKLKKNEIWIDIFVLDNGIFPQKHYKNICFKDHELYPTKNAMFADIPIKIPNKSIEYLDRIFSDWDKYAIIYNHKNKSKKKISFNDQPELLKPYLPEV